MLEWIRAVDHTVSFAMVPVHCPFLDWLMVVITSLGNASIIWIAVLTVMVFFRKSREMAFLAGASLIIASIAVNFIIKPIFDRERPYEMFQELILLTNIPSGSSFPSGHTAASFAVAISLWFYNKKLGVAATAVAALIGFSRIYLYCHFLTDVLAGAVIGTVIALLCVLVYKLTLDRRFPIKKPGRL